MTFPTISAWERYRFPPSSWICTSHFLRLTSPSGPLLRVCGGSFGSGLSSSPEWSPTGGQPTVPINTMVQIQTARPDSLGMGLPPSSSGAGTRLQCETWIQVSLSATFTSVGWSIKPDMVLSNEDFSSSSFCNLLLPWSLQCADNAQFHLIGWQRSLHLWEDNLNTVN